MRTGKSWSSMCRREQHRSGRESWTPLCPVQMISRTTESLWNGRNTYWLQDRLWSYVDPRKATLGWVHEHAIGDHYRRWRYKDADSLASSTVRKRGTMYSRRKKLQVDRDVILWRCTNGARLLGILETEAYFR